MERGIRPWLTFDCIYKFSTLGRENQRCVKALHEFTNQVHLHKEITCLTCCHDAIFFHQVIRDRREALKLEAETAKEQGNMFNETLNNNVEEDKTDAPST